MPGTLSPQVTRGRGCLALWLIDREQRGSRIVRRGMRGLRGTERGAGASPSSGTGGSDAGDTRSPLPRVSPRPPPRRTRQRATFLCRSSLRVRKRSSSPKRRSTRWRSACPSLRRKRPVLTIARAGARPPSHPAARHVRHCPRSGGRPSAPPRPSGDPRRSRARHAGRRSTGHCHLHPPGHRDPQDCPEIPGRRHSARIPPMVLVQASKLPRVGVAASGCPAVYHA